MTASLGGRALGRTNGAELGFFAVLQLGQPSRPFPSPATITPILPGRARFPYTQQKGRSMNFTTRDVRDRAREAAEDKGHELGFWVGPNVAEWTPEGVVGFYAECEKCGAG